MNTEFEWRSALRPLADARQPERDLWPQIAVRLHAQPRRRRRVAGLAIAASFVLACVSVLLTYRQWRPGATLPQRPVVAQTADPAATGHQALTPLSWAVPADPTLAAAAQDLDHAGAQLQRALEQHPDAVFLVGLINRTNAQRMRLMRESAAG